MQPQKKGLIICVVLQGTIYLGNIHWTKKNSSCPNPKNDKTLYFSITRQLGLQQRIDQSIKIDF